jgi:hypothetical protein
MFFLDYAADEYKDNPGFELLGATQLVVSGAVLLTSLYLM